MNKNLFHEAGLHPLRSRPATWRETHYLLESSLPLCRRAAQTVVRLWIYGYVAGRLAGIVWSATVID